MENQPKISHPGTQHDAMTEHAPINGNGAKSKETSNLGGHKSTTANVHRHESKRERKPILL